MGNIDDQHRNTNMNDKLASWVNNWHLQWYPSLQLDTTRSVYNTTQKLYNIHLVLSFQYVLSCKTDIGHLVLCVCSYVWICKTALVDWVSQAYLADWVFQASLWLLISCYVQHLLLLAPGSRYRRPGFTLGRQRPCSLVSSRSPPPPPAPAASRHFRRHLELHQDQEQPVSSCQVQRHQGRGTLGTPGDTKEHWVLTFLSVSVFLSSFAKTQSEIERIGEKKKPTICWQRR